MTSAVTTKAKELLDLLDWKRTIFALYAEVRAAATPIDGWERWREVRDDLYRRHPQSPLPAVGCEHFSNLPYFAYDSGLRVFADLVPVDASTVGIGASNGRPITFERFAQAHFELLGGMHSLDVYWLEAYGGGLFLPFADATSGSETYPAGRYLLDTVKGADLGMNQGRLVLDFNFAYNPSCAYDSRWACPLAPPPNRLDCPVRGGERLSDGSVGGT